MKFLFPVLLVGLSFCHGLAYGEDPVLSEDFAAMWKTIAAALGPEALQPIIEKFPKDAATGLVGTWSYNMGGEIGEQTLMLQKGGKVAWDGAAEEVEKWKVEGDTVAIRSKDDGVALCFIVRMAGSYRLISPEMPGGSIALQKAGAPESEAGVTAGNAIK